MSTQNVHVHKIRPKKQTKTKKKKKKKNLNAIKYLCFLQLAEELPSDLKPSSNQPGVFKELSVFELLKFYRIFMMNKADEAQARLSFQRLTIEVEFPVFYSIEKRT